MSLSVSRPPQHRLYFFPEPQGHWLVEALRLSRSHVCPHEAVNGRGVRYQRAYLAAHPAAILFYTSAVSATYDQLESTLKQGGHKIRRVGSRQELDEALDGGRYDIVLADLDDATTLEQPAKIPR